MKRIIGGVMVLLFLVIFFAALVADVGWLATLGILGIAVAMSALVVFGVVLLIGE